MKTKVKPVENYPIKSMPQNETFAKNYEKINWGTKANAGRPDSKTTCERKND